MHVLGLLCFLCQHITQVDFFFMFTRRRIILVLFFVGNYGKTSVSDKSSHHEPKIGSGKKHIWPPVIGGRDSLPPTRNRVMPPMDWPEDRLQGSDYDGCLDCLPKQNTTGSTGRCKENFCYLNIAQKCVKCVEFVMEFAKVIDKMLASDSKAVVSVVSKNRIVNG